MTQEQKDFETKYHLKIVKPLNNYLKIPQKEYVVTSALYEWESDKDGNNITIFAIKAIDYTLENKDWYTLRINKEDFDKVFNDLEIINDIDDKAKPKILDEVYIKYEREEDGHLISSLRSAIFPERELYNKVPIEVCLKEKLVVGTCQYMFIYQSIYDIGKPSHYIVPLSDLENKDKVEEIVKPFRQDILNSDVAFGYNRRLLFK